MRSIFRLLAANLRHKKGAFTGVVILMAIVTLSYAITVSNTRNLTETVEQGFADEEIGDWMLTCEQSPSEENIRALRAHSEVTGCREETYLNFDADAMPYQALEALYPESTHFRLFTDDLNGLRDYVPLKSGEVYISYKLHSLADFQPGKQITVKTGKSTSSFTVKGYYQDVANSASGIARLCQSDFDRLYAERDELLSNDRVLFSLSRFHVYLKDGTDSRALEKAVKKECTLFDEAYSFLTKEEACHWIMIYASTGTRIVTVFTALLVVIVMIVLGSSIRTAIETEYVNLGILKATGFDKNQLRTVWLMQYALALLIGSVIGLLLAIPATLTLGRVFTELSMVLTSNRVAFAKCTVLALGILLVCTVYIFFSTAKIGRISPVRAISGGHSEIYFDSRLHTRIRQKGLNFGIALRQLTSRCKSYFSSTLIVALLVFFLCTVMVFTRGINADLFMVPTGEIEMSMLSGKFKPEQESEIRKIVDRWAPDAKILLWTGRASNADDEQITLEIYNSESLFAKPLDGRIPKYDNETAVTELFAEKVGKGIGDTITLKHDGKTADFIITGLTQSVVDPAGVVEITFEGGKRIGMDTPDLGYIRLSDTTYRAEMIQALNDEMGDCLKAKEFEPGAYLSDIIATVDLIMLLINCVIYGVSLVFAAVVVTMICRRTFLRERTDLGIFRAIGFSVPSLRMQFALRFLLIAAAGSVIGCICAVCFSGKLLSVLMRIIGITRFANDYAPVVYLMPATAVSAAFFLFAYLASRRVRTVSVRELVTE